jgi:hypothetical protein
VEFYSTKRRMKFHCLREMELENIILSEVSQVQKAKGHMLFLMCRI